MTTVKCCLQLSSILWVLESIPVPRPTLDPFFPQGLASLVLGYRYQLDLTPDSLE